MENQATLVIWRKWEGQETYSCIRGQRKYGNFVQPISSYLLQNTPSRDCKYQGRKGLQGNEKFVKLFPSVFIDLMICGFDFVTLRFELVTRSSELVTRGFELVNRRFEFVTRGFKLVIYGFLLATRTFECVTRGFELITRESELSLLIFNSSL